MRTTQLGYEQCFGAMTDREMVDSMTLAFRLAHAAGVERCQMSTTSGPNLVFGHASVLPGLGMCVKTGIQIPANRDRGIDPVQAAVVLFDGETGEPRAVLDGRAVTLMRTAGALVAGIRAVGAREHPRVAVLGYGAQGRTVARLARSVLGASEVRVYDRASPAPEPGVVMADSPSAAVRGVDVVACCTTSSEPVVTADLLDDGVVVASMGSYAPGRCEIDPEIVRRSSLVASDVAPDNLGPVARLLDDGEPLPRFVDLGSLPPALDAAGTRCVFIGGTGVEDACTAWSILLGWPDVEAIGRQHTERVAANAAVTAENLRGSV